MAKNFNDGCFEATISAKVKIELTKEDIFNWLNECKDPETLIYLGNAAIRFSMAFDNPDEDDFRSRA